MTHRIPISTILLAAALGAQTIDRTKPPETPPLAAYKLPPVAESALGNGLRVVMVEDRRFPLVTLRLAFSAGSKFDPNQTSGLADYEADKPRGGKSVIEELKADDRSSELNQTGSTYNISRGRQ